MTERCEKLYLFICFAEAVAWNFKRFSSLFTIESIFPSMNLKNQHGTCVISSFTSHVSPSLEILSSLPKHFRALTVIYCLIYYWKNFNLFFVSMSSNFKYSLHLCCEGSRIYQITGNGEREKQSILLSESERRICHVLKGGKEREMKFQKLIWKVSCMRSLLEAFCQQFEEVV